MTTPWFDKILETLDLQTFFNDGGGFTNIWKWKLFSRFNHLYHGGMKKHVAV